MKFTAPPINVSNIRKDTKNLIFLFKVAFIAKIFVIKATVKTMRERKIRVFILKSTTIQAKLDATAEHIINLFAVLFTFEKIAA
jgi:hypothetical protein